MPPIVCGGANARSVAEFAAYGQVRNAARYGTSQCYSFLGRVSCCQR